MKQRYQKWRFGIKKAWAAKWVKANPHTLDEVCEYIKSKHGFVELPAESEEYQREYREMRAGFLIQYAPGLLGEQSNRPELQGHSEEEIKQFMEAVVEPAAVQRQSSNFIKFIKIFTDIMV